MFGDVKADTSAEVLRNWEALKARRKKETAGGGTTRQEYRTNGQQAEQSVLAGVSSKMPALMEAYKLSSRAARVGFDWPEIEGLFAKLEEETVELREELKLCRGCVLPTPAGKGIAGSGQAADFAPNCASVWKMRWEICFLCW